jgi:outer membrane protein TolC
MMKCLFSGLVLLLITFHAATGGTAERRVTLSEAIDIALQDNHDVRATRSSLHAQKADVGIARGSLLPQLGVEERVARTNSPPGVFMSKLYQERFTQGDFDVRSLNQPAPVTDYQTMFTLDQPVFVGKALLGWTMAKKEFAAKSDDYERKKEETALRVSHAYFSVRTAKEYVKVARAAIADRQEHLRSAELRHKNGLGLYSDVLRAKTAALEAEQRLVTAEKNESVAKRALGVLLGTSEAVDVAAEQAADLPLRDMEYYRDRVDHRKDVRALEARYENTRNQVRLAESRYLPTIGVRASYQFNDHRRVLGTEGDSWFLAGVLRWELFDGASREYERVKALHKREETEERLKGLRRMASFSVAEAYLTAEEAQKNIALSRTALSAAEEGKKLVASRFANSLSPIVDLLDVQLAVDQARAMLVARENEYRLALVKLAYESGTIIEELGIR